MYLFFLIFLIFVSILLNFLILLHSGKNASDIISPNTLTNIKLFNSFRGNSLSSNIIGLCAFLFLIISLILCNINDKKINLNFINDDHNELLNKKTSDLKKNKILNTKISD